MTQHPTPDDGFGLIGEILTFTLDDIDWRVFEFRNPVKPHETTLIVLNSHLHHSAAAYPDGWRTLNPAELLARLGLRDSPR